MNNLLSTAEGRRSLYNPRPAAEVLRTLKQRTPESQSKVSADCPVKEAWEACET